MEKFKKEIANRDKKITQLESAVLALKEALIESAQKSEKLEKTRDPIENSSGDERVAALSKKVESLQNVLNKMREENATLSKLKDLPQENSTLKQQVETLGVTLTKTETKARKYAEDIKKYQQLITQYRESEKKIAGETDKKPTIDPDLDQKIKEQETQLQKQQATITSQQEKIQNLQKDLNSLQKELSNLQKEANRNNDNESSSKAPTMERSLPPQKGNRSNDNNNNETSSKPPASERALHPKKANTEKAAPAKSDAESKNQIKNNKLSEENVQQWEATKKLQKKVNNFQAKVSSLTQELDKANIQVAQLKEENERLKMDKDFLQTKYHALLAEKEERDKSPISDTLEHVVQLKNQILQLEEENERLKRLCELDKEKEIRTLKKENNDLSEQIKVLDSMLRSYAEDLNPGLRIKDLGNQVLALQKIQQEHDAQLLEKNNQILELRFEKETLNLQSTRMMGRVADLEALLALLHKPVDKFGLDSVLKKPSNALAMAASKSGAPSKSGKTPSIPRDIAELQQVTEALKRVIEKLRTENEILKKNAFSNVKYMEIVKENKSLRMQIQELEDSKKDEMKPRNLSAPETDRPMTNQQEYALLQDMNQQLQAKLERESKTVARLKKTIEEISEQNAELEKTLGAGDKRSLLKEKNELIEQSKILQNSINEKDSELERLKVAISELKSSLKKSERAKGQGSDANVTKVSTDLEKLTEEKQLLVAKVRQMKEQLEKLQEKTQKLEAENKSLKSELSAFDPSFFDEIEDMKYDLESAMNLNKEYEKKLRNAGLL
eukprot:TRINITY_DN6516_c0_g2_i1.p1 TRINITY_DN6516_c0_g2~~TRINITY_DN6516_c0_g2_i1.p1  ORF type:complete len:786 (-),score=230.56 TRINITY_DN6516_c0_g2_i1:74-2431(-)